MNKTPLKIFITLIFITLAACNNSFSQKESQLSATEFAEKIKTDTNALILDVRTPGEFDKGHIAGAKNINYNDPSFENEVQKLGKKKNIYIYCLSGGRSGRAANALKAIGFESITELKGGLLKWRAANLPEETASTPASSGMNMDDFKHLVNSEKIVLVDFYADWCAPCKLMETYLKEIDAEMKDKVKVVRINTDENESLMKELQIDAIPVLHIYKQNKLTWNQVGFIEKAEVIKHLK